MRPGLLPTLVLILALLGAAVPAPVAGDVASPGFAATAQEPPEASSVTFVVDLRADGDARWRVTAAYNLQSKNDTAAFRRLGEQFEAGTLDTGYSTTPFRRAAVAASTESGRSMSITRVNRSARIVNGTNGTGYLVLGFTWTNFSRTSGDRVVVDDAFDTASGTWLPHLGPDQALLIRPPSGYAILSAPKGPVNGTLRWTGPVSFDRDTIDITYERGAQPTKEPPDEGLSSVVIALLVGLLALLVGGGVYVWLRRSGRASEESGPPAGAESPEAEVEEPEAEVPPAPEAETAKEEAETVEEEPELLSDEERVERMLERHGGRMKQANIVEETGWSNAKVSQLLSSMEEEGRIEKLRIGRENLISLPGEMENSEGE